MKMIHMLYLYSHKEIILYRLSIFNLNKFKLNLDNLSTNIFLNSYL